MMEKNPKVTAIMPVYNAEEYLEESIDSILAQTFTDFEFLIFNDGSTDRSSDIIRSYQDPRIKLHDNNLNSGHVALLNQGIYLAQGQYIARMDADDISCPERFEKQVAFMDANPSVGVCGTWFDIIGKPELVVKHPACQAQIQLALLNDCALGHPTVMIRTDILRQHDIYYSNDFFPAEDYYLWTILAKYCELANLQEVLLHYRIHDRQISSLRQEAQNNKSQSVRNFQLEAVLGRELTQNEQNIYKLFFSQDISTITTKMLTDAEILVKNLIHENQKAKIYVEPGFSNSFREKLLRLYRILYFNLYMASRQYNLELLKDFWFSSVRPYLYFSKKQNVTFTIKCLLNWQKKIL